MDVNEFVIKILQASRGDGRLQVKVDSEAPISIEDVFGIVKEKGFLLFRYKKETVRVYDGGKNTRDKGNQT